MSEAVEPVFSADLEALIDQTQPAALKLLDPKDQEAMLRTLRDMKSKSTDVQEQKVLGQAMRRVSAEKRARKGGDTASAAKGKPKAKKAKPDGAKKAKIDAPRASALGSNVMAAAQGNTSPAQSPEQQARKAAKKAGNAAEKETAKAERKAARKAENALEKDSAKAERKAARKAAKTPAA